MNDATIDRLRSAGMIPTVLPRDEAGLVVLMQALADAEYPALEVLCRPKEQALPLVARLNAVPERKRILLGLGTVLTADDARDALSLEPDFVVSPAFSERVLGVCVDHHTPYLPGISTFQDVQDVWEAFHDRGVKLRALKLCPCDGVDESFLAMLGGAFPGIEYFPSGMVTLGNYGVWKARHGVAAPMGGSLVPADMIDRANRDEIAERLRVIAHIRDALAPVD